MARALIMGAKKEMPTKLERIASPLCWLSLYSKSVLKNFKSTFTYSIISPVLNLYVTRNSYVM